MIDLQETVAAVKVHLEDGSARSLTYAALECRLAIERICYERLRLAHDYISHDEVGRRWRPHQVIKLLSEDVDPHVASTYTISISTQPVDEQIEYKPETLEYVPLGTQVGFDGATLAKLWNALSNTALHVKLPRTSSEPVNQYGEVVAVRKKVEEALAELERIGAGTLTSTGIGQEVSFECECGIRIKRRSALVPQGKVVHCVDPTCEESWEVERDGDDINFVRRKVDVACACGKWIIVPLARLERLRPSETLRARCGCGNGEVVFHWRLFHGIPTKQQIVNDVSSSEGAKPSE